MGNNKRIIIATILGCIAYVSFDMLYHGQLLTAYYEETKHLWRNEAEMEEYGHFGMLSTFLTTLILAVIFSLGYQSRGIMEGVRFGILFGLLFAASSIGFYYYMPIITPEIVIAWAIGSLISTIIVGMLFALAFSWIRTSKKVI